MKARLVAGFRPLDKDNIEDVDDVCTGVRKARRARPELKKLLPDMIVGDDAGCCTYYVRNVYRGY